MRRVLFDADHDAYRDSVRTFLAKEVSPFYAEWERAGIVPRELFRKAGDLGVFGIAVPEQYGGAGLRDLRYSAVLQEKATTAAVAPAMLGPGLQADICLPYFLELATDEQQQRWRPGIASGETITAIAMTEPGTGSDLSGIDHVRDRTAFGRPLGALQTVRHRLAELVTEVEVAQHYLDRCVLEHNDGGLSGEDAAKAKWWCTELQGRVLDACVQLHGGYGYMTEYPIARAWADGRVSRIYAGATEIMKEIIGKSLRLG
ncbi:acyl-CoA dehydrogenase family protein [Pseudonocardia saturnea]